MNDDTKKNPLLGCFEIALFMKIGFNRFHDGFKACLNSFSIVFLNLIITLFAVPYVYEAKANFQEYSLWFVNSLFAVKYVLITVISLLFVYYFCKVVKRKKKFTYFVTVSNWCSLIAFVLFLPIQILFMLNFQAYDDMYPFVILISLYGYAISTFVVRYIIDIPWEMSVFMVVCLLAINQAGHHLLNYIL